VVQAGQARTRWAWGAPSGGKAAESNTHTGAGRGSARRTAPQEHPHTCSVGRVPAPP
jgi:hypothetical protein